MKTNTLVHVGSYEKISPTEILMLKADINYTTIYLEDGKQILSSTSIGILEKRLKEYQFLRPNRSTVINISYISKFEDKTETCDFAIIVLKNNEEIRISRRKVKDINSELLQNCENQNGHN